MEIQCSPDDASGLIAMLGDNVGQSGFVYRDGVLVVPPAYQQQVGVITADPNWPAAAAKLRLGGYAALKRYAIEIGGITIDGRTIATDRQSQAMISGAYSFSLVNPALTIQFKTANGFIVLAAADIAAIATAVAVHVQTCFAKEATVAAAIDAGSITSTAGVDNAFAAS